MKMRIEPPKIAISDLVLFFFPFKTARLKQHLQKDIVFDQTLELSFLGRHVIS
jgi:hypothetical protein